MRAAAILIGFVALMTAATWLYADADPEAPNHEAFFVAYWATVLVASTAATLLLRKVWAVAVIPLLVVGIFVARIVIAGRVDSMFPVAVMGLIVIVVPALALWLAGARAVAAVVRRSRAR